jgi:hypothetical protein
VLVAVYISHVPAVSGFFVRPVVLHAICGVREREYLRGRECRSMRVEVYRVSGRNQHVVQREDGWSVRGEGAERDTSHHRTQAEAIDGGREIARNQRSELLVHDRQGELRARDSYGGDPSRRAARDTRSF